MPAQTFTPPALGWAPRHWALHIAGTRVGGSSAWNLVESKHLGHLLPGWLGYGAVAYAVDQPQQQHEEQLKDLVPDRLE